MHEQTKTRLAIWSLVFVVILPSLFAVAFPPYGFLSGAIAGAILGGVFGGVSLNGEARVIAIVSVSLSVALAVGGLLVFFLTMLAPN